MSISPLTTTAPSVPVAAPPPPAARVNDHDADDRGSVSAALPAGVGTKVDVRA